MLVVITVIQGSNVASTPGTSATMYTVIKQFGVNLATRVLLVASYLYFSNNAPTNHWEYIILRKLETRDPRGNTILTEGDNHICLSPVSYLDVGRYWKPSRLHCNYNRKLSLIWNTVGAIVFWYFYLTGSVLCHQGHLLFMLHVPGHAKSNYLNLYFLPSAHKHYKDAYT
jgi:hypothetical protein